MASDPFAELFQDIALRPDSEEWVTLFNRVLGHFALATDADEAFAKAYFERYGYVWPKPKRRMVYETVVDFGAWKC